MIKIKPGEPQPEPCFECGEKHGYLKSDIVEHNRLTTYSVEGKVVNERYSGDERINHQGKSAYCSRCNNKLPIKLLYPKGRGPGSS